MSKIRKQIMFYFDGSRKDSKRISRIKGIKFFHKLMLKFTNKDFMHLNCLKNDKPCSKTVVLILEKIQRYEDYFPLKKNHLKCLKLEVGSKVVIDPKTKFWARLISQSTFFDYTANDIRNLLTAFSQNQAKNYRRIVHFSFPLMNQRVDDYAIMFQMMKELRGLKQLSFNVDPKVSQDNLNFFLKSVGMLGSLKALFLQCKITQVENIDQLTQMMNSLAELRHLSLQVGKLSTVSIKENFLRQINKILERTEKLTHIGIDIYIGENLTKEIENFFQNIGRQKGLLSLNLKLENKKNMFHLIYPEIEVLKRLKYTMVEGTDMQTSNILRNAFLIQTKNLITCNMKNVSFADQDFCSTFFKNDLMQEVQFVYDNRIFLNSLEHIFNNIRTFSKLNYFSVQYDIEDAGDFDFDIKIVTNSVGYLANLDTFVLGIVFPIQLSNNALNKLFQKLSRLQRLASIELELRSIEMIESSAILEIFFVKTIEIITMSLENVRINSHIKESLKGRIKDMMKLATCTLELEDFSMKRTLQFHKKIVYQRSMI